MKAFAVAATALALAACEPALDQRLATVDRPRVLAIVAEPPEAHPGDPVTYRAVVAGPDGPLDAVPAWAFCTTPKAPTEDDSVAAACVAGHQLVDLGAAPTVTAPLPADGCLRFGPDTPPGGFRPRDADDTGGYYQPVRAAADDEVAIGLTRITCHLPTAPLDVAHDYDARYVANINPSLDPPALLRAPAHTAVTLTASWPAAAAERYLAYDRDRQQLVTRREALRVSWYATAGSLAADATAVGEDDPATTASTTWTTPDPGPAWLWIVLRDSRGGLALRQLSVTIE
ncbi:MAG TPA: hypothetical protein VHE35_05465 [Kofleriaceae bacterium]|nr:hypothetical protein [Kofleriaceae bacterium]